MSKPTKPRWADTVEGDATKVFTPISAQQDTGWIEEEPPFQIFNWLHVKTYRWINWIESKLQRPEAWLLRSDANLSWNGASITFTQPIELHFRNTAGALYINRIAAAGSPIALNDGDVVVAILDRTNASPVTLALEGTYGSLGAGEYAIVAQASLTLTREEDEVILFRRSGTNLQVPMHGLIYPTGASIALGNSYIAVHNHSSATTGGQLDWDEVWADAVHNHESNGEGGTLSTAAIASGTFADARIAQSNVTQHQAALTILETQITDGAILARVGGNETVTGSWTFPSTDPPAANATTRQGISKGWVSLSSIGAVSNDNYNVSAGSRISNPGEYEITWDTDSSNIYQTVGSANNSAGADNTNLCTEIQDADTTRYSTFDADAGGLVNSAAVVHAFGNQ